MILTGFHSARRWDCQIRGLLMNYKKCGMHGMQGTTKRLKKAARSWTAAGRASACR